MIRRFGLSLLTIVALVLILSVVCQAQGLTPLTRHVREVTLNGQARPAGHLPAAQTMRLTLVLPLRNEAELDNLLQELYDPSSLSYRRGVHLQIWSDTGRLRLRDSFCRSKRPHC
jgi:hypothetical protein